MALYGRHDHGMGGMAGMGSSKVPGYYYMQQMFWVVIGTTIGVAALCNLFNYVLFWQRSRSQNARPQSPITTAYATITAMTREIANSSFGSYRIGSIRVRSPRLGKTIVVLSYIITVIVFCFYQYDTEDQWSWEDIAYRVGCVAQAQLPLVFLLAGKQNIIGYLIGSSYEQLNWLHRWISRTLWLTVTLHMSFFFRSWARYDYIKVKLQTDSMTQTGFAAWCILTVIVLTSFLPVRRWNYEVFVIQHVILLAGLTGAIMIHVDSGKVFVWISIAFYFFDRLIRFVVTLLANLSIFHRNSKGFWANNATFTPLPGNVTKVSIDNPVVSWKPGQHMFLSCHSVAPLQSHPFTVATLPSDGRLDFIVRAHKGGTKRFLRFATKSRRLPDVNGDSVAKREHVGIEGPYGSIRPLQQFDSLVFFAGSTGATFTMPLMRDIVRRWVGQQLITTRRIRFVWIIKSRDHLTWFMKELTDAISQTTLLNTDVDLDISIYITCDEEFVESKADTTCSPLDRGDAEIMSMAPTRLQGEKLTQQKPQVEVKSISSEDAISDGCGPNGTCCCKATVEDEDDSIIQCCCKPAPSSNVNSESEKNSSTLTNGSDPTKSELKILTGRPKPRSIIRKVLEEADGESAVVVCGPQGLQDDVRHSVVALSDERAVHKGTGAQGIYLHVEGFSY